MSYEMINRQEAVTAFHRLMTTSDQMRVLRLVGEEKMSKTFLLTKVFPALARQPYQAPYAILNLNLKTQPHPVANFLCSACSQLDIPANSNFYRAYKEWTNRPRTMNLNKLIFLGSNVKYSFPDNQHEGDLYLTTAFAQDLRELNNGLVLLLFNQVHSADKDIQTWLMDTLLVQLSSLSYMRVVIAGCSLPMANDSYAFSCETYELLPVKEDERYIEYCRSRHIPLEDQSIRDLAHVFQYRPGLFIDYVIPAFTPQQVSYA